MKANEAPKKIYIHRTPHLGLLAASEMKITGDDVEYIRKDAFIEKAADWLKEIFFEYENLTDYNPTEDFKKYMKGE
jgi:hypothetical protein